MSTIFSYRYCTHAEGERKGRKVEGKNEEEGHLEPIRRLIATCTALEERSGRNGSSAAQQGLELSTDKAPSAA